MALPSLDELNLMHSTICHAVGDPKRIQILYALHERPQNVNSLAQNLNTPQPTISRHLAILRQVALVNTRRAGTNMIYTLADPRIITVLDSMREMLRDSLERQSHSLE
jgi:ArsR family transcriptional regulator